MERKVDQEVARMRRSDGRRLCPVCHRMLLAKSECKHDPCLIVSQLNKTIKLCLYMLLEYHSQKVLTYINIREIFWYAKPNRKKYIYFHLTVS